ncbi:MAG: 2-oxo acid dehydrogenase subunit E2 [SAR202 cluster bacterium]|nr:2-oxo acid dehydrogenase subunit E2 [SAR202 cluster bacterium]|tara:strand:- start:2812 stop:4017 length:1206 start_codon:yes stop_codon:yes gene_type:complete
MATEIVMPKLGMVMTEGTVSKWNRAKGDAITQGEVVLEIETEKLNYELEATASGKLHPVVSEGAIIPVNGLLGYLLAEGEAPPELDHKAPPTQEKNEVVKKTQNAASPANKGARGEAIPSTPGARKLAAKLGINLSDITPTGPRGRVVEADVRAHGDSEIKNEPVTQTGSVDVSGMPSPAKVTKMSGMRQGIASHMLSSLQTTAQLTFTLDIPVTELQSQRKAWSKQNKSAITNTHVYTKICGEIISKLPVFNSMLSDGQIFEYEKVDIGIAVALPEGLIVPVIKDVMSLSLSDLAQMTSAANKKALAGQLSPDEVSGGTFTISVLGVVEAFTPILNRGQSAILGVGVTKQKAVVDDGKIVIKDVCTFNLTVDHQLIDGAVAAEFMKQLATHIENPDSIFK